MRQGSPLFRAIAVCFAVIYLAGVLPAQKNKNAPVREGSLRVMNSDGTEKGLCPLKRTEVKAKVSGFVSRVNVTQVFQNPLNQVIEAVYKFPLPNDAAVDALTIEIGGRIVRGTIMQRQKAKDAYEQAKQDGKTAALLEQDQPGIFTQALANITPSAEIKVIISYVETLHYEDDAYEFRFPMTIGAKYMSSSTGATEVDRVSPKSSKRPGHTISLEIDIEAGVPVTDIASATHEIETASYAASKFIVRLKDAETIPNKDFLLRYKTAGSKIEDAILSHRDRRGGFFTLILQPPDHVMPADTMPKEVVFVLDTSGSMSGFPIAKARESMKLTLDNLNPYDTFNVITFAGETNILFPQPVPASPENLAAAKKMLDDSSSGGGTELMKAIAAALEPSDSQSHVRITCFMTDGEVSNEAEIIEEVRKHANARVFAFGIGSTVNHRLLDEITREGRGEVRYVSENDDGSKAARQFFERIRNPLMTDISLEFRGVEVNEVFPQEIPDLFDAKPVTITGRYKTGGRGAVVMRGMMQGQPFSREIAIEFPENEKDNEAMASLWARQKLAAAMRPGFSGTKEDQEELITGLGLEYHLVTPFTSFVAVEETRVTEGTPPKRVEVPAAEPEGEAFIENYWKRQDAPKASTGNASAPLVIPPGTPSGISASVNVVAETEVSTTSTSVSSNVTSRDVTDLPLNGRSFQSVITIAPAVEVSPGRGAFSPNGLASVNGQTITSNEFRVDGIDTTRGLPGGIGALPQLTAAGGTNAMAAIDAIEEIEVRTFSSVERGRSAGGTFSIVTKSGSNDLRGSLFETFGNGAMNADDPFANANGFGRAPSNLNLFGGTLGGPFKKDKAFFFANYEGMRLRQAAFETTEVPGDTARAAALPGPRAVYNAFPVSNGSATRDGFAEFSSIFTNPAAHDIFGFRTDFQVNDDLHLTARYSFADSKAAWRGGNGLSLNTLSSSNSRSNSISGSARYIFGPNLIGDIKAAFSRNDVTTGYGLDTFGGAVPPPLVPGSTYDIGGRARLVTGGANRNKVDEFQITGSVDFTAGAHIGSFGADLRRFAFDLRPFAIERNVLFAGLGPSGIASRISELTHLPLVARKLGNFSVYGTDKWQINSRVALTGGVRWDMDFNSSVSDDSIAFQNATGKIPNSIGNFAPRVGIAIDPFGNGKTLLNAGIGLYYDFNNLNFTDIYANSYPYTTGAYGRNILFDAAPGSALTPVALFAANLKTPHTWQIFAEYRQQIFNRYTVSASFAATYGRNLLLTRNILGADPAFNIIRLTDNFGESNFQSLRLGFDRRFADGFSFNSRYSWSRSTDNLSTGTFARSAFASPADDNGPSDLDARHTLSLFGTYDIPRFFSGRVKWLARDWSLSANLNARSAYPVNVVYAQANDLGIEYYRPDAVPGVPPVDTTGALKTINSAAFSVPAVLRQGTLGRNAFRGFPLFQINASIQKTLKINESSLKLKAEVFNVFNTVNYENMSGVLGTRLEDGSFVPNYYFGRTTASLGSGGFVPFYLYGGPRTIQLSAKFAF